MTGSETKAYRGNCHCGRHRFQVKVPEIKDGITCTCSLCTKKGYIWLTPPEGSFEMTRDDGQLREYESGIVGDKFCNHCGTGIVAEHRSGPLKGKLAANIRAIQDVNPFDLEPNLQVVQTDDDRKPIQAPPVSDTDKPAHQVFACHCGNVVTELLTPFTDQEVKEDNCSSCVRNAYIGVYPTKSEARIHGRENTFEYVHGKKFGGALFCKTCGVNMFSNVYGPPISIFDKLPPERRERALAVYHKNMDLQPLNARAIEGKDISSLQIERSDEGTEGYVLEN